MRSLVDPANNYFPLTGGSMKRMLRATLAIAFAFSLIAWAMPQAKKDTGAGTKKTSAKKETATKPADHGLFTPGDIKWVDAPNALPAGAKLAVLEGNPFQPGALHHALEDARRLSDHATLPSEDRARDRDFG